MNPEGQFLDLIRADLDNPVPRLVYADWLDDQGDPRGEFIRVQCELERSGLSSLKHRRLRDRERELLQDHQDEWLSPVDEKKRVVCDWTFRRGLVEEVAIGGKSFLKFGDSLQSAFPLLHVLTFNTVKPSQVDLLVDCSALEGMIGIRLAADFGRARERQADWQFKGGSPIHHFLSSPHLKNLRSLRLLDGTYREADLRGVLASGHLDLHAFDLSNFENRLGLDDFETLASAGCLRNLRELSLRSNDLTISHLLILTYSRQFANLESLDLRGNLLGSQSNIVALVGLNRFPKLRQLNLQSCGVGNTGIQVILAVPLWQRLESLILWNNGITDRGLIQIAQCKPPAKLRALELRRNAIGDAGLIALAASPVLAAFEELHLEHNRIEEAGVQKLAESAYVGDLRELHLRGNAAIGDSGGTALAGAGFRALEVLDLAGTQVGDATAIAWAKSPASARLQVLDLAGTRLTETGALALAESEALGSLAFLDLRMNHLKGDCVTALVNRFGRRVLV